MKKKCFQKRLLPNKLLKQFSFHSPVQNSLLKAFTTVTQGAPVSSAGARGTHTVLWFQEKATDPHYLWVWTQYQRVFFFCNLFVCLVLLFFFFFLSFFVWFGFSTGWFGQFKTTATRVLICIAERTQFQLSETGAGWCTSELPTVLDNTYFKKAEIDPVGIHWWQPTLKSLDWAYFTMCHGDSAKNWIFNGLVPLIEATILQELQNRRQLENTTLV